MYQFQERAPPPPRNNFKSPEGRYSLSTDFSCLNKTAALAPASFKNLRLSLFEWTSTGASKEYLFGSYSDSFYIWDYERRAVKFDAITSTTFQPSTDRDTADPYAPPPKLYYLTSHAMLDGRLAVALHQGDVVWMDDPFDNRNFRRFNQGGSLTSSPVTAMAFVPTTSSGGSAPGAPASAGSAPQRAPSPAAPASAPAAAAAAGPVGTTPATQQGPRLLLAHADGTLTMLERDLEEQTSKITPVKFTGFAVHRRKATQSRRNPVAQWSICAGAINAIRFSPCGRFLALACADGFLRMLDFHQDRPVVAFRSYYGGLTCVDWSLDGRYLVTGGEDDLVSVWSFEEHTLVARGHGHQSWVNAVAFDPYHEAPSAAPGRGAVYRIGSVGMDTRLCLWDFVEGARIALDLTRGAPEGSPAPTPSPAASPATAAPASAGGHQSTPHPPRSPTGDSQATGGWSAGGAATGWPEVEVASPSLAESLRLNPVACHVVDIEPLTDVSFTPGEVLTAGKGGRIKVWARPGSIQYMPTVQSGAVAAPAPAPTPARRVGGGLSGLVDLLGEVTGAPPGQPRHAPLAALMPQSRRGGSAELMAQLEARRPPPQP
ncbi:putative transducin family protein [Paratrimastix pyriformis]|uniref:Transducin family protein n=1 Tax=Paratrimastix pyriformis TaxID=342808 RepID=A0ABQ8U7Q8_9EUKA|nr:putative transducin family protein [Paratrimastix pyriformis]